MNKIAFASTGSPFRDSSARKSSFTRGCSALLAAGALAVGGFGALSATEAHAAGVKTANYAVVQSAAASSSASSASATMSSAGGKDGR